MRVSRSSCSPRFEHLKPFGREGTPVPADAFLAADPRTLAALGCQHVAVADGYCELAASWANLLRDAARRGMHAPVLAVGDGALGFWRALAEVFPETRHQRCWVHKTANVLDALPKSTQPAAKHAIQEVYSAEDKPRGQGRRCLRQAVRGEVPQGRQADHGRRSRTAGVLRLPRRALDPHRVHLRHRATTHEGYQGCGQRGCRPGDGLQARRVCTATMASGEPTRPRRPGPGRSLLRTRPPRRTARAGSGIASEPTRLESSP